MLSYTVDHNAQDKQRNELVTVARSVLQDAHLASRLVDSLCRLSPPRDPPNVFEMITVHSMGASGGRSRKPGNIIVNFRYLVRDFGDIGLVVSAGAANEILIPLAALAIWNKVRNRSTIELTPEQAGLVYAMWLNCDSGNLISRDEAFDMFKLLCKKQGLAEPSAETFSEALTALISFGSVESHKSGKIWLREYVKNIYL